MAGDIKITGDLTFIGYKQKANPGINRQVLTYVDGEAVWQNLAAENLVTSPSSEDVIIDNKGDIVVSELNTYSGIDTKPDTIASANPVEFVKRTIIDGTTSVTFIDQSDVSTTFTPPTNAAPSIPFCRWNETTDTYTEQTLSGTNLLPFCKWNEATDSYINMVIGN